MEKNNVPLYWNSAHTHYAVLVSHGYGAGWSTWHDPRLAYDGRIVDYWTKHNGINCDNEAAAEFVKSLGYIDMYMGGWRNCELEWIPAGKLWRVAEYDGAESVEFFQPAGWNCFTYEGEEE